jgi:hypothetical protein
MHKRLVSTGLALGLGLSATLLPAGASAEAISGKKNLICASDTVVACADGICMQGPATDFDMVNFMFVDAEGKMVYAMNEEGEKVVSPINSYEITDNAIILQGFENHRGWTIGIDRGDGKLTMSATGADLGFMVFGDCNER